MRRWNGWGDVNTSYSLSSTASYFLTSAVGQGDRHSDCTIEEILTSIPPSRLKESALYSTEKPDRLRHARGQSLPDWIALRSGRISEFPDGVAYPTCNEDVRKLLAYAGQNGIQIIPYLCPSLSEDNLIGGYRFFDAQTDDARLVLRIIFEAIQDGGVALNYARVVQLLRQTSGRVCGVALKDECPESGERTAEILGSVVVNVSPGRFIITESPPGIARSARSDNAP